MILNNFTLSVLFNFLGIFLSFLIITMFFGGASSFAAHRPNYKQDIAIPLTSLAKLQDLILSDTSVTDRDKLDKVNNFFNQIEFASDIDHWGKEDYWATPIEFLTTHAGDCEDFSIAKYFTLQAMGVPEEKLNLTYVKSFKYNTYHMILTYYSNPEAEPLILDNIIGIVRPASERTDLVLIYSFNGSELRLAKQRGLGKLAGNSSRLKKWQGLIERMSATKNDTAQFNINSPAVCNKC
jgi:predicted transglutaminase-like cysteine proteinase